jgi:hypothetical protein
MDTIVDVTLAENISVASAQHTAIGTVMNAAGERSKQKTQIAG